MVKRSVVASRSGYNTRKRHSYSESSGAKIFRYGCIIGTLAVCFNALTLLSSVRELTDFPSSSSSSSLRGGETRVLNLTSKFSSITSTQQQEQQPEKEQEREQLPVNADKHHEMSQESPELQTEQEQNPAAASSLSSNDAEENGSGSSQDNNDSIHHQSEEHETITESVVGIPKKEEKKEEQQKSAPSEQAHVKVEERKEEQAPPVKPEEQAEQAPPGKPEVTVVFGSFQSRSAFQRPVGPLQRDDQEIDHGFIQYQSSPDFKRFIRDDDLDRYHNEKVEIYRAMAEEAAESDWAFTDKSEKPVKQCDAPDWSKTVKPVCNVFHEQTSLFQLENKTGEHAIIPLGEGAYRETFLFTPNDEIIKAEAEVNGGTFVLKKQNMDIEVTRTRYFSVHNEASILDQLTAASSISDIGGHCATSIILEAKKLQPAQDMLYVEPEGWRRGYIHTEDLKKFQQETGKYSISSLTPEQKLEVSIGLVESIAELHGLPTGPVILGDLEPKQWLVEKTDDGHYHMILADFDISVVVNTNTETGDYCIEEWWSVGGPPTPERISKSNIDEKADVWLVGESLYSFLTGLVPYHEEFSGFDGSPDEFFAKKDQLLTSKLPFFDPAYKEHNEIEKTIMEAVEMCMKHNPAERASIFEVLAHLRSAKQSALQQ